MKRILLFSLALLLAGCSLPFFPTQAATPTMEPSPVPTVTLAATGTPVPTATYTPTRTPDPNAGPVTATAIPAETSGSKPETVIIFLTLLGDNGTVGDQIGCGDSLVPVEAAVASYTDPTRAALEALFATGETQLVGFKNGLSLSNLTVSSVTILGKRATVKLSGELLSGGSCDDPRIIEQIKKTVSFHNPGVTEVNVLVNGRKIEELLSLKGK
jgi:hypothetical protein